MKIEIRQSDGQVLLAGNSTPLHGGNIVEVEDSKLPALTGDTSYADFKWDGIKFILNKVGNIHRDKENLNLINTARVLKATLVALKKLNPTLQIPTVDQIKAEIQ